MKIFKKKAPRIMRVYLRYDGNALSDHKMDVSILAPALISFGDLFKEANKLVNGNKTKVKVLVNADIEANCVTLSLEVVQSTWEAAKTLLKDDDIASAKDLIEWVMIVGGSGLSLFAFLAWLQDKKEKAQTIIKTENQDGTVVLNIQGNDNQVTISNTVYKLSQEKKIIKAAQGVVRPVASVDGIDSAEFFYKKDNVKKIDKSMAKSIVAIDTEDDLGEPQPIEGHITVHSPVLSESSKKWKFLYNGHIEEIDISETTISKDVMARGKVIVGDTWKVSMEIRERKTQSGYKNEFKVIRVLDFTPGSEQQEMIFHDTE